MGRMARGWQLTKMSLRVIRKDKEILVFPVLSGLITIMILGSFFVGVLFTAGVSGFEDATSEWLFYVYWIAFYFVAFFVSIFFNVCIIGCATIRMNGGDPTVMDGLRIAKENLGRILVWALFAATVGLVIRAIQNKVGFIGKLIMGGIGVAWTIVTYFVVPVLVYEHLGPLASVKRSVSILKTTWGEALVGNLGVGLIFGLASIPGILLIFVGITGLFTWGLAAGITILAVAIVYLLIVAVIASAAETVLVAALYRFATTGKVSEEFQGFSFDRPFVA
ncbi:MAG TPA: DUF6159 family protein [Thermoplasmata archaeon]